MWYSRINHLRRHAFEVLPYLSFLKLINLIHNLAEKQFRTTSLKSYPVAIKIEPTGFCQLQCPGCAHNDIEYNKSFHKNDMLNEENLQKILEQFKKYLLWVSLSHRGEPFLNKNLTSLIKIIHDNNIAVSLPTNFSIRMNEDKIEQLARSGLDKLFVSLDGASEQTYSKYRVGGIFNQVLLNVNYLANYKKKNGLKRPTIIWKFIVFEHNKHEIDIVKSTYKSLGFDSYVIENNRYGKEMINIKAKEMNDRIRKKKNCYWLWNLMVIQSDGGVKPCCLKKDFNIGNAFSDNLKATWNNKRYIELRSGFQRKNFPMEIDDCCKNCYKSA